MYNLHHDELLETVNVDVNSGNI